MAGGGGSTGGIGAQSPAVNPPNPMGQIGNAVGGALGGQPQNPMGGGNFVQTGQFGSQPIDMGGGFGSNMGGGFGGMGSQQQMQQAQQVAMGMPFQAGAVMNPSLGNNPMQTATPMGEMVMSPHGLTPKQYTATANQMGMPQAGQMSPEMQRQYAQPGQDYRTVSPQQMDQMRGLSQQMDAYMQTSPAMKQMQDLQAKIQSGQLTPEAGQAQGEALNAQLRDYQQNSPMMQQFRAMQQAGQMSPEMQQANAQRAFDQRQSGMGPQPTGQMAGLGALLGGMPNQPTPTAQPAPVAAKPAPVAAKPATMAAKPMAKPSVVPPRTPPAVASAIQKLAAKKPMMRR
jgi:hypothetical protein